jgi:hypothetical protein
MCDCILNSKLLFSDDLKINCSINNVDDCTFFSLTLILGNDFLMLVGTIISCLRKTVNINFDYKLCNDLIVYVYIPYNLRYCQRGLINNKRIVVVVVVVCAPLTSYPAHIYI